MSVNDIPDNLYWLLGKGRTRPSEPMYAAQLIDPESGIAIAEGESETLDGAIAAAIEALPAGAAMVATEGGASE